MNYASTLQRLLTFLVFLVFAFPSTAYSQIELIERREFFGEVFEAGVDDLSEYVPGAASLINFDQDLAGNDIETTVPLAGGILLRSPSPLTNTYLSVGVMLGNDEYAITRPGSAISVGAISCPNGLAPQADLPNNDSITIDFMPPVEAAAVHVTDGPTNDVQVRFFDSAGDPIGPALAPPTPGTVLWFVGLSSEQPIARIVIITTNSDDYYIDNLYYGTPNPLLLGDINLDRALNLLDVDPFISLLDNGEFQAEADINQDGSVNLLDVMLFVDLFMSEVCD